MQQTLAIDRGITLSPTVMSLREELADGSMKRLARFELGALDAEVCRGREGVWCIVRRERRGGLALRAAHVEGLDFTVRKTAAEPGEVDATITRLLSIDHRGQQRRFIGRFQDQRAEPRPVDR